MALASLSADEQVDLAGAIAAAEKHQPPSLHGGQTEIPKIRRQIKHLGLENIGPLGAGKSVVPRSMALCFGIPNKYFQDAGRIWRSGKMNVEAYPFGNRVFTKGRQESNFRYVVKHYGNGDYHAKSGQVGYRFDRNGWIYVHIEGDPHERGYQHGNLVAPELKEILRSLKYLTYWNTGMQWEFFVQQAEKLWTDKIDQEFLDEMKGIADGAKAAGVDVTWQEILAWNGREELTDYWWPTAQGSTYGTFHGEVIGHCSAFAATGSATKGGKIVMAHNSWDQFETGQFANMILDIQPATGHRIFMQADPGYIDSFSDFFVTDAGLMGTETTIGGFGQYDPNEVPEFFRVRKAMQYANNLDDAVELMKKRNNGGYANSWLFGDAHTGEIMRFELGLKFYNVERTKDGYYIGFNAPLDPRIRNLECSNTGYADLRRHQGARQVRLTQLTKQYNGAIDVEIAQKILADHYDVYLKKENNPCSRTVDGHYELDAREYMSQPGRPIPFQPRGTVDGKVMDSDMAKTLSFWARWGNSSGMPFDAKKFLEEQIQWSHLEGYLKDRPSQPWTLFKAGEKE